MFRALFLIAALAPPPAGTLQGTVRAAGSLEPIPGATVLIEELGRGVGTDPHGYFVLSGIPEGSWRVEARALGYESLELTIMSAGVGTLRLDFELELRPVVLPEVEARARGVERTTAVPSPSLAGPSASRVQGSDLRVVPGLAEPDVLRGLQTLPAVGAISDYSSALYVRGGSGDQNLITLDGIPLFNPYHLGGVFSAIGMDAVSTVELWPGALPAHSGDRLSSTVAIHTRNGGQDRVRASGAVGLISSHLTVDGPLPGRRGSYLFTGRRTYLDLMTDVAYAARLISFTVPYAFSDAYFKATHPVGELGAVSLSAYIDSEGISMPRRMRQREGLDIDFGWGSKMLALSYRQPLGGSLLLHTRLGYSDFRGSFNAREWEPLPSGRYCESDGVCFVVENPGDTVHILSGRTKIRDLLAGADLTWYDRAHTLRAGFQLDAYHFDHGFRNLDGVERKELRDFDEAARLHTLAAYLEDEWRATERLSLRAGVRLLSAGPHGTEWLPRLGVRLQLTPSLALSLGAGRYAQALRSMRDEESMLASLIAYDVVSAPPPGARLPTSEDLVAGVSWTGERSTLRFDAYTRRLAGLVMGELTGDPVDIPPLIVDGYRTGRGTAHGLEIQAGHRLGAAELRASYALSFFEREVEGERFPPRFERRHLADATALFPLGQRGQLSSRLVIGSGQPATPVIGYTDPRQYDPVDGRWRGWVGGYLMGEHNSARLPGYFRLDVAARKSYAKRWFGREVTLSPYLQILNVLNTRNVLIADGWSTAAGIPQLPILPTFGVEWKF